MKIQFAAMMRKYNVPYTLVRPAEGHRDEDGVNIPGKPQRVQLMGHIQPISAQVKQEEPGRYTAEDKMLFTTYKHASGEVVEWQGVQYTISTPDEREYSDIRQYVLKKVVASGTVQKH
ncbi:hypothetical protein [Paenibacillus alvei]|uniref:hypothetical protein n=1 Tax=Paenibacillus alvei TaxID=44250 RepID=UPI0022828973|nr:hypothetical protein [Paenibacillus alvei]MCY7484430.1 hypothetical protein [Paenibacillus alvei]